MTVGKSEGKKGGIEPLEVEAFKNRIRPGDKLKCYKPRRKGDDEDILMDMTVEQTYPCIIGLRYCAECGKYFTTSMTWGEAIILNRMTQEELTAEVAQMQRAKGIPYYKSPLDQKKKMSKRKRNAMIVRLRDQGETYVDIAKVVGLHSTSVRVIYQRETGNK